MDQLRFSIPEILSLLGVTQSVYIVVYMFLRSGRISRGGLPLVYFFVLALAFFFDMAERYLAGGFPHYFYLQWLTWFYGPPLSVLLVIQIAQIGQVPGWRHYWVLFLIPAAYLISQFLVRGSEGCAPGLLCPELKEWLNLTGLISGAVSLLAIWFNRGVFEAISQQKTGKDRYWLILAITFINLFFIFMTLAGLKAQISHEQMVMIRTILGLAFLYLVGTSLFRIYPQAVYIADAKGRPESLSPAEQEIAAKIENLLNLEKVYHEPSYSRADLARECGASEAVVSRVINIHFQKSFPQLINEHRVEDAKRLLLETDAPLKTVAEEVGFNALASFNRVFKDLTGKAPGGFRKSD